MVGPTIYSRTCMPDPQHVTPGRGGRPSARISASFVCRLDARAAGCRVSDVVVTLIVVGAQLRMHGRAHSQGALIEGSATHTTSHHSLFNDFHSLEHALRS